MFCRKCGQELKPGAKFCTKCGTPLAQGVQQPGQTPSMQQPGQVPPMQQPGQVPPMQQPGQTPPMQQPGQVPPMQQPGQVPPMQQPGQVPPQSESQVQLRKEGTAQQPGQTPPVRTGGQTPSRQQPGQMPPMQTGGQVPPRQTPPGQPGQMPQNAPKKKKTGLIIALVCVIILAIAVAAAVGVILYFREQQGKSEPGEESRTEQAFNDTEHEADNTELPVQEGAESKEVPENTEAAAEPQEPETVPAENKPEKPKAHDYQFVVGDVTWTEAFQAAQNIPGGHLLNINSEKEWKKIIKKIKEEDMEGYVFWIGATRRGNSRDYLWVDASGDTVGEPMNENEHWLAGEPSFYDDEFGVEERYVNLFYSSTEERWVCNDTADDVLALLPYYSGKLAYIVEIEYD